MSAVAVAAGSSPTEVEDWQSCSVILARRRSRPPTAEDSAGHEVKRCSYTAGLECCRCSCFLPQQPQQLVDST